MDQYGSDALSNMGHAVFYDAKGGVWSLATGASAGAGAPQDTLTPNGGSSYLDFAAGVAATYQDDLIVSNPLRRVSPSGAVVWSLPGTTGIVASDGKVILVLGRDAVVAVDPGSGKTLAQAPTSPSGNCSGTLHVLGRLAVVGSKCVKSDTTAYTIGL